MSTTSLKLPQDVKQLVIEAAEQQEISPHAFMVSAIRSAAVNAEKRNRFVADALAARNEAVDSGEGHAAQDVHAYLRARAEGRSTNKPKSRSWRK